MGSPAKQTLLTTVSWHSPDLTHLAFMDQNETFEEDLDIIEDDFEESPEEYEETENESDVVEEDEYSKLTQEEAIERLRKAESAIEKNKKKVKQSKPTSQGTQNDDTSLLRLEARGILDSEEQEYVLRFAKVEGVSPVEALNDPIVKDKLAFMKKNRIRQQASQAPTNRSGGSGVDEVERAYARYKKDGTVPTDPSLATKLLDKLTRG